MNAPPLDLNLLLVFEAMFLERSVGRAARRMGLTQPGMSNALSRLRRTLGDPLFVRGTGQLTPTARALAVSAPLLDALGRIRSAVHGSAQFDPERADICFRVLTTDYGELFVVSPLVRRLRVRAPSVSVQGVAARRCSPFRPRSSRATRSTLPSASSPRSSRARTWGSRRSGRTAWWR